MPKFKPHKNRTSQPHPLSVSIKFQPLFLLHLIASNIQHKGNQKEHVGILSRMATVTSAAVAIPSFTGLKAATATTTKINASAKVTLSPVPRCGVRASMKEVGVAVVATAASAMLASNAMALEILLGSDNGELAFVPSDFSVPAGEKIVFKNNAGFPHNVVFDEDEVPSGVDVSKISMGEADYLNGPGETYSVTLTEKGDYKFYCAPHQGAGMVGKVTIN